MWKFPRHAFIPRYVSPRTSPPRTRRGWRCRRWRRPPRFLELVSARTGDCRVRRCAAAPPLAARLRLSPLRLQSLVLLCRPPHRADPRRIAHSTGFWRFQRISTTRPRCEVMTEDMVSETFHRFSLENSFSTQNMTFSLFVFENCWLVGYYNFVLKS